MSRALSASAAGSLRHFAHLWHRALLNGVTGRQCAGASRHARQPLCSHLLPLACSTRLSCRSSSSRAAATAVAAGSRAAAEAAAGESKRAPPPASFAPPSAPLPFTLPAPSSLPPGCFVLAYLAQSGHLSLLLDEVDAQQNAAMGLHASVLGMHGNLVLVRFDVQGDVSRAGGVAAAAGMPPAGMLHPLHMAHIWYEPRLLPYRSITHACESMRALVRTESAGVRGVKFTCYTPSSSALHRRSQLVLEQMPRYKFITDTLHTYPLVLPAASMQQATGVTPPVTTGADMPVSPAPGTPSPLLPPACFTLLDSAHLLVSLRTSSLLPLGSVRFAWDRHGPPSRAYLKLWEALARAQLEHCVDALGAARGLALWEARKPGAQSLVLDLGAAPGGWTWALSQLGCTVLSVDRSELAPSVSALPRVHHFLGSGFSIGPEWEHLVKFLRKKAWKEFDKARKLRAKTHTDSSGAASASGAAPATTKTQAAAAGQEAEWDEEELEVLEGEDRESLRDVPLGVPQHEEKGDAEPAPPASSSDTPSLSPAPLPFDVHGHARAARVDWLVCDIVSYPERSLRLIERWLAADAVQHGMIVSIKLQSHASSGADAAEEGEQAEEEAQGAGAVPSSKGPAQSYHLGRQESILAALRCIPHARLVHLDENKHEATFIWVRPLPEGQTDTEQQPQQPQQPQQQAGGEA